MFLKLQIFAGLILLVGWVVAPNDQTSPSAVGQSNPPPVVGQKTDPKTNTQPSTGQTDKPSSGQTDESANGQSDKSPDGQTENSPDGQTDTSNLETKILPNGKKITVPKGRSVARSKGKPVTFGTGAQRRKKPTANPKSGTVAAPKATTKSLDEKSGNKAWSMVKKSYYSFLCSTLHFVPFSLGELPLKLKSLKERILRAGLPRSCANLILNAEYSLKNVEELKRKLEENKITVVWVVGGPGSGKGTLCKEMAKRKERGFTHISIGDSFRSEVKKDPNSIKGHVIQSIMTRGNLMPDVVVLSFLVKDMLDKIDNSKGFLLDGFPRSLGQAKLFKKKIKPPDVIVSIESKDETMKERVLNRNEGRADDNEETIKKRIKEFHKLQKRITSNSMFKSRVKEIDGEGLRGEVFQRFAEALSAV